MYLVPALSDSCVGKNEKAYVSVPTFLFTHSVALAGHSLKKYFLICEMRMISTSKGSYEGQMT